MLRVIVVGLAFSAVVALVSSGVQIGRHGPVCRLGPCLDPIRLGLAGFIGFLGWGVWKHMSIDTTLGRLWAQSRRRLIGSIFLALLLGVVVLDLLGGTMSRI